MVHVNRFTHMNVLQPSTPDTIALSSAVQERFINLLESYQQNKGIRLIPPKSLDGAMIRWRSMVVRHRKGDFRNSQEEQTSLREIAQWTVDENCKLRNQPLKKIDWG